MAKKNTRLAPKTSLNDYICHMQRPTNQHTTSDIMKATLTAQLCLWMFESIIENKEYYCYSFDSMVETCGMATDLIPKAVQVVQYGLLKTRDVGAVEHEIWNHYEKLIEHTECLLRGLRDQTSESLFQIIIANRTSKKPATMPA